MAKAARKSFDFEQALAELEGLVNRLEQADLSLEESLQTFERGIELTRRCQQALTAAEQRVEQLVEKNGRTEAVPFDADAGD